MRRDVPAIEIEPHPALDAGLLAWEWPVPLGEMPPEDDLVDSLRPPDVAPLPPEDDLPTLAADDAVRRVVRDLLRHGGYKPTGRGKPASEYLLRAASDGKLGPINAAVDVCNVVSLHSGLPISVVDLDLVRPPLRIAIAGEGAAYVFNPSGQTIRLDGLLCLHDEEGPCANAVRDAQRTKTSASTTRTLTVIWGTCELPGRTEAALAWYAALSGRVGKDATP